MQGALKAMRGKMGIGRIGATLVLFFLCCVFAFPIYWTIVTSLKLHTKTLIFPPQYIPTPVSLHGYSYALRGTPFVQFLKNSLVASFCGTAVGLLLGVPAAYGASRYRFKGRDDIMFLVLSSRFLPPITAIIPLYMLFRVFGLLDSLLGLSLIYAAASIPLTTWVLKTYFDEIPKEIEESYMLDGHSRLQAFLRITLPLSAPGIVAVSLLSLVGAWGDFLFALVLTSTQSAKTLPVAVSELIGDLGILWQAICVYGIFALIPPVVVVLILQKHLVRGLTMGALK